MQKEHEYGPLDPQYDAKAMCIKVTLHSRSRTQLNTYIHQAWLQLSTSDPVLEHKVIFSGLSAIILEKSRYHRISYT